MLGRFHHEIIYRGADAVEDLAGASIIICGAGALGSNLADTLVRQGFRALTVIDRDRVEEHNVNTQIYSLADIGNHKADVLANRLFRSLEVEIKAVRDELTDKNVARLLKGADVVIDTFDNSASRAIVTEHCAQTGVACLHAGLFADYGEVIWNERYRVPQDGGQDVCDYPLARNLVLLTVSVAAEVLIRALLDGVREDYSITLRDFHVRSLEQ